MIQSSNILLGRQDKLNFYTKHLILGTPNFMVETLWVPYDFTKSTALQCSVLWFVSSYSHLRCRLRRLSCFSSSGNEVYMLWVTICIKMICSDWCISSSLIQRVVVPSVVCSCTSILLCFLTMGITKWPFKVHLP